MRVPESTSTGSSSFSPNLEPRPITAEQLMADIRAIYDGVEMVDRRQEGRLTDEGWNALITLHRTLLLNSAP